MPTSFFRPPPGDDNSADASTVAGSRELCEVGSSYKILRLVSMRGTSLCKGGFSVQKGSVLVEGVFLQGLCLRKGTLYYRGVTGGAL
eukprot:1991898-Amphidinium_carterae.1